MRYAMFTSLLAAALGATAAPALPLRVVTTLNDYALLAQRLGGERVVARALALPTQDAHFVRPKPSYVSEVARADVLISTGLDLELWLGALVDRAGNARVRSGEPGFVSFAQGLPLSDVPTVKSRAEGDLHVYGNPHVLTSPLLVRQGARNVADGLIKNDPDGRPLYERNLAAFQKELDERLFGTRLVEALGGETLARLAQAGKLQEFLSANQLDGKPALEALGGWLGAMQPLRGTKLVTYHRSWPYLLDLFGLVVVGEMEPKPGIPPSARHMSELLSLMATEGIRIVLSENYYDAGQVRSFAARAGARALVVPAYSGGAPGVGDYFALVDAWTSALLAAAR